MKVVSVEQISWGPLKEERALKRVGLRLVVYERPTGQRAHETSDAGCFWVTPPFADEAMDVMD
jgi:hypothetical protein